MTNLHRIKLTDNYVKPKFFTMNEDDKRMFLALVKGKDISEIMSLLAKSGNQYSRRILRFFRWFSKWVPILIMTAHMYGVFDHGLRAANGYNSRITLLLAVLEVPHTVLLLLRCQLHTPCLLELVHNKRDGNGALCNHGVYAVAICLRSC